MSLPIEVRGIVMAIMSVFIVSVITTVILWAFLGITWIFIILATIFVSCIFLIWNFRNPWREIQTNPKHILSPADGTIIEIAEQDDGVYIVVRMSPFDVHMTRTPIEGVITNIEFQKGSHWPVYFPNYAKRNQRNIIEIHNEELGIKAIVTQVSGIFARRTICYKNVKSKIKQGEVIGTIRFGSITSVKIISAKKFKVVEPTPRIVRAGLTILAKQETDSD
jgi:phosphatidylserine decarboxylase